MLFLVKCFRKSFHDAHGIWGCILSESTKSTASACQFVWVSSFNYNPLVNYHVTATQRAFKN